MVPPVFDTAAVHAPPRIASWLGLALAAGSVNAIALLACARFVTHVTGSLTRVGTDIANIVLLGEYLLVVGAFVLGAGASVFLSDGRRWRGLGPRPWLPLAIVAMLLLGCAVAGSLGAFGRFGGSIEEPSDFALLVVLAFAMGLQNAAVATATGMLVRTTHMTGPATDLGIALATLAHPIDAETQLTAKRSAILRAGKMLAFASGASVGVGLGSALGYAGFAVPALLIAVIAGSTFRIPVANGLQGAA